MVCYRIGEGKPYSVILHTGIKKLVNGQKNVLKNQENQIQLLFC